MTSTLRIWSHTRSTLSSSMRPIFAVHVPVLTRCFSQAFVPARGDQLRRVREQACWLASGAVDLARAVAVARALLRDDRESHEGVLRGSDARGVGTCVAACSRVRRVCASSSL